MRLHLLLATLTLAGLSSSCGPAPATLAPEATTDGDASSGESSSKQKPAAPVDTLLACSDQMSTGSSTDPKRELTKEERSVIAEEDAAIFARLSDARCPSEEEGAVSLFLPPESASLSINGGTVKDCAVAECVLRAVASALPGHVLSQARGRTLGIGVNGAGTLTPTDPEEKPSETQSTYCGHQTSGRLPAEGIRKVVRAKFDVIRGCYEDALGRDREIVGKIGVRFVIELDGTVSEVQAVEYTFPECDVGKCVLDAFETMVFSKPLHGTVTVTYPIVFSPG